MTIFDNSTERLLDYIGSSYMIANIADPSDVRLVNPDTMEIRADVSESAIKKLLTREELALYMQQRYRLAHFEYNPHIPGLESNQEMGSVLNTYMPPFWKRAAHFHKTPLKKGPEQLPELYDRYFKHLFNNDEKTITYVLDWLANALRSRNNTILTAVGDFGVGKGIFGEIMGRLVGEANFVKTRDEVLKNKFNAPFMYKQLVYIDEVEVKTIEHANRIKDVVNERIEIERKGVDPISVRNFASFYITANNMDAIRIDGNDRRFSVVELTDTRFTKVFNVSDIAILTSDEMIEQLALFLLDREITSNLMEPLRTDRYMDIMEATSTEWELWLIEEFFRKKELGFEIGVKDLQKTMKDDFLYNSYQRPPGRSKIANFCKKYPDCFKFYQSSGDRIIRLVKKVKFD